MCGLQYAFVSFAVDYICIDTQGQSLTNQCLENKRFLFCFARLAKYLPMSSFRDLCKALQFSTEHSSSIVSEWDLVCEQNYKSKGTMSAFMAGVMLG